MKLFHKLAAIKLPGIKTRKREAKKLFAKAVQYHSAFHQRIKLAKADMINAGFNFLQAKAGFEHGDWEAQCKLYEKEISFRTIQRYMQFAELTTQWIMHNNPGVKDLEKIRALAINAVMVSPKSMVEIMREIGELIKFGGYFSEDYEQKKKEKLLGDDQIEFDFSEAGETLKLICSPKVKLPDDVTALEELQGTLKSAELRVAKKIKEVKGQ